MGAGELLSCGWRAAVRGVRAALPSTGESAAGAPEVVSDPAPAAAVARAEGLAAAAPIAQVSEGPQPEPAWTPTELAQFRAALDAELERLNAELRTGEALLANLLADSRNGAGDDQADVGAKTFERENEITVNANTRELLDQAMHAMARLDAGTYGICESCGRTIGAGRLRAFPRATLCLSCKQAQERR